MKNKSIFLSLIVGIFSFCRIGFSFGETSPLSSDQNPIQIPQQKNWNSANIKETLTKDIPNKVALKEVTDELYRDEDAESIANTVPLDTVSDIASKVFVIRGYARNSYAGTYAPQQYGSAVLIAKDIIITNAHVVTNEEGTPLYNYEVCETISTREAPKCFSTARLLSYDKKNDLALLQLNKSPSSGTSPVKFGSDTIQIGTNLTILGYPSNGGSTITATQGTVAGFQNGLYKTDANLDEGNSGGGAFDQNHLFVGIPTFVVNGQTTMGYIVPLEKITSFLKGETGIKNNKRVDRNFENYINAIAKTNEDGVISNRLFTTPSFKSLGLSIDSMTEKPEHNFFDYTLYDEDDNNMLSIQSIVFSKNANIKKYVNAVYDSYKSVFKDVSKTTKTIGTTQWNVITYADTDLGMAGFDYIQTNPKGNTLLEYSSYTTDLANKTLLANLTKFVEETIVKASAAQSQKSLSLPGVSLSSKWGVSIFKYMEYGDLVIILLPENRNAQIRVVGQESPGPITDQDLKEAADSIKYMFSAAGISVAIQKVNNMYLLKSYEDGEYSIIAIGASKGNGKNYLINIVANYTAKDYEKELIEIFKKILPIPATKK